MVIAVVAAAALASACGDSQDEAPGTTTPSGTGSPAATDTSVPGATTPSPEQQLLEGMILEAEDLPGQLMQVSASVSTNEDLAEAAANPEEEMARLESWGRLLGYDVTFLPGPDSPPDLSIIGVNSTASIYLTPEGASASLAEDLQAARSQDWTISYPDLADLEVREIERSELADEVLWIRIAGYQQQADGSLFIEDFVVMRQSRVRSFLRLTLLFPASADTDTFLEETASLASRQVERIDAGLEES